MEKRKFAICNLLFFFVFGFLKQGHHLTNFEAMKLLFQFLKVKNIPRKHWNNNARLKFAQTMSQITLSTSKETIHATSFLVSFYEVTIVDKQFWLTFMLTFEWFQVHPTFVECEKVSDGTFDNLCNVILNSWLVSGGFIVQEINNDLFWFWWCWFLSCVHNGVITQIPFMVAIHCVVYWLI